jgi:hypothetical protein
MCFQATCGSCAKPTWQGCGRHIDTVSSSCCPPPDLPLLSCLLTLRHTVSVGSSCRSLRSGFDSCSAIADVCVLHACRPSRECRSKSGVHANPTPRRHLTPPKRPRRHALDRRLWCVTHLLTAFSDADIVSAAARCTVSWRKTSPWQELHII